MREENTMKEMGQHRPEMSFLTKIVFRILMVVLYDICFPASFIHQRDCSPRLWVVGENKQWPRSFLSFPESFSTSSRSSASSSFFSFKTWVGSSEAIFGFPKQKRTGCASQILGAGNMEEGTRRRGKYCLSPIHSRMILSAHNSVSNSLHMEIMFPGTSQGNARVFLL